MLSSLSESYGQRLEDAGLGGCLHRVHAAPLQPEGARRVGGEGVVVQVGDLGLGEAELRLDEGGCLGEPGQPLAQIDAALPEVFGATVLKDFLAPETRITSSARERISPGSSSKRRSNSSRPG